MSSGAPFLALCQKMRLFRPRFRKNNFWEHLQSKRGYYRYYFKPNFRSLRTISFHFKGLRVTTCWVPERLIWLFVKKRDHLDPNFGKIFSGNIFDHRGYSRDYFKPNFRSLGPLLLILQGFEWWDMRFRGDFFGPVSKIEVLCVLD